MSRLGFLAMASWCAVCTGIWAQSFWACGAVASAFVALAWLAEEYA